MNKPGCCVAPRLARDLLGAPAILGHEEPDDPGVELGPGEGLELADGLPGAAPGPVGRVPRHGVEDLGHGHDAGPEGTVLARQPRGVPLAVPALVMAVDDGEDALPEGDGPQHLNAQQRLLLYSEALPLGRRAVG